MAMNGSRFRNRSEAGRLLAAKLAVYAKRPDVNVLALPRGGVPVAYEIVRHPTFERTAEWEAGEVPETSPFGI